jgi:hypothetical protein
MCVPLRPQSSCTTGNDDETRLPAAVYRLTGRRLRSRGCSRARAGPRPRSLEWRGFRDRRGPARGGRLLRSRTRRVGGGGSDLGRGPHGRRLVAGMRAKAHGHGLRRRADGALRLLPGRLRGAGARPAVPPRRRRRGAARGAFARRRRCAGRTPVSPGSGRLHSRTRAFGSQGACRAQSGRRGSRSGPQAAPEPRRGATR